MFKKTLGKILPFCMLGQLFVHKWRSRNPSPGRGLEGTYLYPAHVICIQPGQPRSCGSQQNIKQKVGEAASGCGMGMLTRLSYAHRRPPR